MRLLHAGNDHVRRRTLEQESESVPSRHRAGDGRKHLPLRHLSTHHARRSPSRRSAEGRWAMNSDQSSRLAPRDEPLIEAERYEFFEDLAYSFAPDRRDFFKIVGGGLVVALVAGDVF